VREVNIHSVSSPTAKFFTGALVLQGSNFVPNLGVLCDGPRILGVLPENDTPAAERIVLPEKSLLAPGLIDIQVNGGGGCQFNDAPSVATMTAIAAAHRRLGTAFVMPTLITDTQEKIAAALLAAITPVPGVLGLHLEGPFLSPAKPGVHEANLIRPLSADDLTQLVAAAPSIYGRLLITLAPETVAPSMIAALRAAGIIVSAGHSAASAEQTCAAIEAGVSCFTHVFNAMPPITARGPGIAAVALADPTTFCGVIADGHHVKTAALRLLRAAKGVDRIILVSDSMACAGTDWAGFTLGSKKIQRAGGVLTDDSGTLAGADIALLDAVRGAVALIGVSAGEAVNMASRNPAALLGLSATHGAIAPGQQATMTVLTPNLDLLGLIEDGFFRPLPS
jgi:N-acetylglucosamine-6-phosphate deacetylase